MGPANSDQEVADLQHTLSDHGLPLRQHEQLIHSFTERNQVTVISYCQSLTNCLLCSFPLLQHLLQQHLDLSHCAGHDNSSTNPGTGKRFTYIWSWAILQWSGEVERVSASVWHFQTRATHLHHWHSQSTICRKIWDYWEEDRSLYWAEAKQGAWSVADYAADFLMLVAKAQWKEEPLKRLFTKGSNEQLTDGDRIKHPVCMP